MSDIRSNGQHERIFLFAIEEPHLNIGITTRGCCPEPMHPVDDSHGVAMHQDRRQGHVQLSQYEYADVFPIFTR